MSNSNDLLDSVIVAVLGGSLTIGGIFVKEAIAKHYEENRDKENVITELKASRRALPIFQREVRYAEATAQSFILESAHLQRLPHANRQYNHDDLLRHAETQIAYYRELAEKYRNKTTDSAAQLDILLMRVGQLFSQNAEIRDICEKIIEIPMPPAIAPDPTLTDQGEIAAWLDTAKKDTRTWIGLNLVTALDQLIALLSTVQRKAPSLTPELRIVTLCRGIRDTLKD